MTKRNLILLFVSICLLFVAVWGGSELAYKLAKPKSAIETSQLSTTINPHAKVSAQGFPLPSEAQEDLLIELTDTSENADFYSAKVLYDYDTGEYEVLAFDQYGPLNIVFSDGLYYIYDTDVEAWYEISQTEALETFDVNSVYFSQDLVDDFLRTAVFLTQSECEAGLCASWQSVFGYEGEDIDTLTIRVENLTRKIFDINAIGTNSGFTLRYIYQNVDIETPSPIEDLNIESVEAGD